MGGWLARWAEAYWRGIATGAGVSGLMEKCVAYRRGMVYWVLHIVLHRRDGGYVGAGFAAVSPRF